MPMPVELKLHLSLKRPKFPSGSFSGHGPKVNTGGNDILEKVTPRKGRPES